MDHAASFVARPLRTIPIAVALAAFAAGGAGAATRKPGPPPGVTVGSQAPPPVSRGVAPHQCVCPAQAKHVRSAIEANRARLGVVHAAQAMGGLAGGDEPWFAFYPMAGTIGADVMNGGFVDLDPSSPGFHDYACRPFTYDGHEGIDTGIRSFGEQFIGMPVFAARDGVVVFAQDGWPDTNLNGGVQGNIVAIDHGIVDGAPLETQYYHLKMGSVAVSVGQMVAAGQQIGMVGSSGNSFGPHLHFGVLHDGVVEEPFAGPCRAGDSRWLEQGPLDTESLFLHDFGITRTDLFTLPQPWWEPWALPTDGQIEIDDQAVVFWWYVYNFPADCLVRVRFYRPDGSLATDTEWNWGNTELWRVHKNWFAYDLEWMGPVPGTWRLLFELDGQVMMDTPFEMVEVVDPGFNRAPAAISASFEPAAPDADDVVFCRVGTDVGKEDPDWDIVRYRYLWRVDGEVVRDVISAAQSDALPRGTAGAGLVLQCTVTPSDGVLEGPEAQASVVVAGEPLFGDLDGNGAVGGADLGLLLGAWGACPGCAADLNGDGVVDGSDLGLLLGAWS